MSKFNVTIDVRRDDGMVVLTRKIEIADYSDSAVRRGKSLSKQWLDKLLGVI